MEENGQDAGGLAFEYAAGVCLIVIQDKELAAADRQPATIDLVPFFAGKNRLQGKAADVVITIAFEASGVKDDVLATETVEMVAFVKSGGAMVGQRSEIHRM